MKYNKLVRDKIPQKIIANGDTPVTHIATDEEYWEQLKGKLQEEVAEFIKDDNEEELADILEVIDAINDYKQFDKEKVRQIKKEKAEKRGAFKERIILDEA